MVWFEYYWTLGRSLYYTILHYNTRALSVSDSSCPLQDMLRAAEWEFEVPSAMKKLPMSLMGHCALRVNNDLGKLSKVFKR